MKKNFIFIICFLLPFSIVQYFIDFSLQKSFVGRIITILVILFSFYFTCFAGFINAKYLRYLYNIKCMRDKRITLLDELLDKFRLPSYFLLLSIVYFTTLHIFMESDFLYIVKIYSLPAYGVFFLNIFYAYKSTSIFIKIVRQSSTNFKMSK